MWRLSARSGLAFGLAFVDAALEVGAGLGLVFGADDRDCVDRVVGLAVTAAVEAVTDGLARGGREWGGSVAACERGFAGEAAGSQASSLAAEIGPMPGLVEQRLDRVSGRARRVRARSACASTASARERAARSRMTAKIARSSTVALARARILARRRSSCLPVPSPIRSRRATGAVACSAWSWLSTRVRSQTAER